MWAPYLDQVRAAFAGLPLRPPTVPVWSATTVAAYPGGEQDVRDVVLRHLLEPVRFRELTTRLYAEGVRAFVQMGPGSLPGFVSDTLHGRDHLAVSAGAARGGSGLDQLRRLAAALWTEGLNPRWDRLAERRARGWCSRAARPVRGRGTRPAGAPAQRPRPPPRAAPRTARPRLSAGQPGRRRAPAPSRPARPDSPRAVATAPANRDRCRPSTPYSTKRTTRRAPSPMPGDARNRQPRSPPRPPPAHRTRRRLSLETMPYVRDHCVYLQPDSWPEASDRFPVVPMTTLLELAADAARQAAPGRVVTGFADVRALRWLPVAPPVDAEFHVTPDPDGRPGTRGDRRTARPSPSSSPTATPAAPPPTSRR